MSAMLKLFKCHAINLTKRRWQQVVKKALEGKGPPAPCLLHPSFAGRGLGGSEGAGSPRGQPRFLLWLVQVPRKCHPSEQHTQADVHHCTITSPPEQASLSLVRLQAGQVLLHIPNALQAKPTQAFHPPCNPFFLCFLLVSICIQ